MASKGKDIKRTIFVRVAVLYYIIAILAVVILCRVVYIQQVKGTFYKEKANRYQVYLREVQADRGNILSDDHRLLATTVPTYQLHIDLAATGLTDDIFNKHILQFSNDLNLIFPTKSINNWKGYLQKNRRDKKRYCWIANSATFQQINKLKESEYFKLGSNNSGLIIERRDARMNRKKPLGTLASRTIGFTRQNYKVGLEGSFDEVLAGVNGRMVVRKIPGGYIPLKEENKVEPIDGKDIYTNINVDFQDITQNALRNTLTSHKADHGCAVLMEVATGEIKALANLTYSEKSDEYQEQYNYAVGGCGGLEPGSTFKLASLMVALEDDKIKLDEKVDLNKGKYKFGSQILRDATTHDYNEVTIQKAFEISSNVGIGRVIAQEYSTDEQQGEFIKALKKFHLEDRTGIEIKGELSPRIGPQNAELWNPKSDMAWLSVGYNAELSPLQILAFYNAVANNGVYVKPRLVKAIGSLGVVSDEFDVEVYKNKLASKETITKARELLRGVAVNGTARGIQRKLSFPIAGKTGTTQVSNAEYDYEDRVYQSSFAGYFPADNPKYSCIVVVYHPQNGVYYGSAVAAPAFAQIAEHVFNLSETRDPIDVQNEFEGDVYLTKGLIKEQVEVLNALGLNSNTALSESEWGSFSVGSELNVKAKTISEGLVPDVRGMSMNDAFYLLEDLGIQVRAKGKGKVKTQSVRPGTRLTSGNKIYLEFS